MQKVVPMKKRRKYRATDVKDVAFIVAMESTGTYGDALRTRLTAAGLEVHRVGSKAAHEARDKDRGKGALTAVMRKLALAVWAVGARGERFEDWRLFPGRTSAQGGAVTAV